MGHVFGRRSRCCDHARLACESPELARGWSRGVWAGRSGRPLRGDGYRLGRGLELLEVDLVAEGFELALESAGAVCGRVALVLPVGSEIAVADVVADDVVVGDEQVVADRADCFLFAAAAA